MADLTVTTTPAAQPVPAIRLYNPETGAGLSILTAEGKIKEYNAGTREYDFRNDGRSSYKTRGDNAIFQVFKDHNVGENVITNHNKLSEDVFTKTKQIVPSVDKSIDYARERGQYNPSHSLNVHDLYKNLIDTFTDKNSDSGTDLTVIEQRKMTQAIADHMFEKYPDRD